MRDPPHGCDDSETRALLQLSLVPGVGPRMVDALLVEFGSPVAVVESSQRRLEQVTGVGREVARRIVNSSRESLVDDEWKRCDGHQITLMSRLATTYPRMLTEIHDPPPILYANGDYLESDSFSVAIVGTRRASRYGLRQAELLAASLSRAGLTIVSGLARGIDAAAHRATLAVGGRTIAVMAGGLMETYPPEHCGLADEIARQGAVISEMPLASKPRRGSFPRRNRLISGLTLGVLVIEATRRSGALITARHALEQGREVFAVPGPIDSRASRGTHQLLRDGAKLVETAADVLDELGPLVEPLPGPEGELIRHPIELRLNAQEQIVLRAIDDQPTAFDQIVQRSSLPAHRILATLSVLEMRHLIRRVSGNQVARR